MKTIKLAEQEECTKFEGAQTQQVPRGIRAKDTMSQCQTTCHVNNHCILFITK